MGNFRVVINKLMVTQNNFQLVRRKADNL